MNLRVAFGSAVDTAGGFLDRPEADEYCPECDSGDTVIAKGLAAGIDTTYKLCQRCDHQWGHE